MTGDADSKRSHARHWLSRPFVRAAIFLAAGAVLHVGAALLSDAPPGPRIVVTDADVAALEVAFVKQTGREPDATLLRHLVDREVDDRLLIQEARRHGWHRTDPVVQRRLIQNQRFLETAPADAAREPDETDETDASGLLERAYAQGMDRTDVVVRRRLLERMRLAVAEAARLDVPSREELEAYRLAHLELFRRPARIDLTHVYLSRDRHGDALADVAAALGERLATGSASMEDAAELGDPSLLPTEIHGASHAELARRFGHDFADAAFAVEVGELAGPVPSSFGLHFVYVSARTEERDPPLDEVEAEVRHRVEREREKEALIRLTQTLRSRAVIETPLDGPEPSAAAVPGEGGSP
jgi:hypothetical protein